MLWYTVHRKVVVIMAVNSLTIDLAPDILTEVRAKARNHNLEIGQVAQRLLTAWYKGIIPLPDEDEELAHDDDELYPLVHQLHAQMEARPSKPPMTEAEFEAWRQKGAEIFADVDPYEFAATIRRWRQEDLAREQDPIGH